MIKKLILLLWLAIVPFSHAVSPIMGGGSSASAWGSITGTLSGQTDLQNALDLKATLASPTFTGTVTTPSITLSGNQSSAAWTTSGLRLVGVAGTLTDTTSSGTVAAAYTNKLGGNTIATSSATTFTNYISSYFSDPVAGTNVTLTNKYALGADSLTIAGVARITSLGVGATPSGTSGQIVAGGLATVNELNIGAGWAYWAQGAAGGIGLGSGHNIAFKSTTTNTGNTGDVGISRISAGLLGVGNGTAGSFAGDVKATKIISDGVVRLKGYTVATLPASPVAGDEAYVTDATAPTYLGALTGGSNVVCTVFYNGTAWVSH